jgi:hypothetical protein
MTGKHDFKKTYLQNERKYRCQSLYTCSQDSKVLPEKNEAKTCFLGQNLRSITIYDLEKDIQEKGSKIHLL